MNHKQFEKWVLDDAQLNDTEKRMLEAHLAICKDCQKLKSGWENNLKSMCAANDYHPAEGFTARWQKKIRFEQKRRRIIRMRLIMFSGIMLILVFLFAYILLSGSFSHFLANWITFTTQVVVFLTEGLTDLTSFFDSIPVLFRVSAGIFLVSVANIFFLLLAGILWKAKKNREEMQGNQQYAQK